MKEHTHDIQVKNVNKLSGTKVRLTVALPEDTVRQHEKSATTKYQKQAKIAGFRPGMAPLTMIQSRYGSEIRRDVISHLLEAGLRQALEETKLYPVSEPSISLKSAIASDGPVGAIEFEAEFEVEPEVKLKKYKGIKLESKAVVVGEEEIDQTLKNLQDRLASVEPSDALKPEKGLFAVLDLSFEYRGDRPHQEPLKTYTIELGAEELLPDLEKAVMAISVGESTKVSGVLPDAYPEKHLAGKTVEFDIKLVELKKKVLPALDDKFAAQIKEGSTLEQLKTEIRTEIEQAKKVDENKAQRKALMDKLIENHSFDVPESMVAHQAQSLLKWMEDDLRRKGIKRPPAAWSEDELKEANKRADSMVRSTLLLRAVAEEEKITVDELRVEAKIDAISNQMGKTPQEARTFLTGRGILDRMRDEVLTEQIFDFLIANADKK